MDTALLAKVQRAFLKMGLLHEDYEPGAWDAQTERAYTAYMRQRNVQRYPRQLNLNDTALVRDIVSVLSVRNARVEVQHSILLPVNDPALVIPPESESQLVDGGTLDPDEPDPAQEPAPATIPPEPVAVEPEPVIVAPAPVPAPVASERDKLAAALRLLKR